MYFLQSIHVGPRAGHSQYGQTTWQRLRFLSLAGSPRLRLRRRRELSRARPARVDTAAPCRRPPAPSASPPWRSQWRCGSAPLEPPRRWGGRCPPTRRPDASVRGRGGALTKGAHWRGRLHRARRRTTPRLPAAVYFGGGAPRGGRAGGRAGHRTPPRPRLVTKMAAVVMARRPWRRSTAAAVGRGVPRL